MNGNSDRSVLALFSELARESGTLIRQELHLARAEMGEKAHQASSGVTSMVAGGAIIYAGFLVLLFALTTALHLFLQRWDAPMWVAPLVVGLLVALIGFGIMRKGRADLEARNLLPRRTAHSLRRDRDVLGGHNR